MINRLKQFFYKNTSISMIFVSLLGFLILEFFISLLFGESLLLAFISPAICLIALIIIWLLNNRFKINLLRQWVIYFVLTFIGFSLSDYNGWVDWTSFLLYGVISVFFSFIWLGIAKMFRDYLKKNK